MTIARVSKEVGIGSNLIGPGKREFAGRDFIKTQWHQCSMKQWL